MDLNFISIIYLFLRLSPFILVCFFSLASLFNQDFKGLIYLVGLIFTCAISILMGMPIELLLNVVNRYINPTGNGPKPPVCEDMISLGQTTVFRLPIGQTIFGYTFAYLLSIITNPKHN